MKVIVFLADGFEEVEALTVVDYLRRMEVEVDTVSITLEKEVRGSHNIRVLADKTIDELKDIESYQGVVIPGGLPGAANLRDDSRVIETVKKMNDAKKLTAAICAGPIVLAKAGIIEGKKVTSYPGFEDKLAKAVYQEQGVVRDGNIITARGPSLAVYFALEIAEYLLGKEKAQKLRDNILLPIAEAYSQK
ncbi:MAG: DJ-1 family glyoxalase III [Caldicoprobacterales bacterium]|jgi:4-methyl-5(b-hydroxyethyl)-thiazole monophosphate biosynthesis|nr:DJ-1/PfpI family protein [Clostridiales bacterium]